MQREPQPQNIPARVPDAFLHKGISKPAVQPFSFKKVVQRSKFLEEKIGKKEGKYTRRDVIKYLFKEIDPDNQMTAITDWNKENPNWKNRIDPDILIPTDEHNDPGDEFMPPMWVSKTEESWGETPFKPTSKTKPAFYSSKQGTAPRMELKETEEGRGRDRIDIKGEQQYACNACLKPTPNDSLQTDHAQPASDIEDRQKKIIARMNQDADYEYAVKKYLPDADVYFVGDAPDIQGTKLYFHRFYNHMENLWFLCSRCNGLTGKSGADLLFWLGSLNWFGPAFIKSLGKVNTKGILMRTMDGQTVAQKAIEWAITHGREELGMHGTVKDTEEQISEDIREVTMLAIRGVHASSDAEKKKAQSEGAVKEEVVKHRVQVVKKAARLSLVSSKAMIHAHDNRQLEKQPAFQEGKSQPHLPNPYQPHTPQRRSESFIKGQEVGRNEEAIVRYPLVLKENEQLHQQVKEKDVENAALMEELEQLKREMALLKLSLQPPVTTTSSPTITTTTTVEKKANITEEDLKDRLKVTEGLAKTMKRQKLRQLFEEKVVDKGAWEDLTQTARDSIIAGVLIHLNLIKEGKEVAVYAELEKQLIGIKVTDYLK